MKKRWLIVPIVAGVVALAIMGGTALAQSGDESGDSPLSSFTSRVASILGLDEATVQDAMDQAREEIRDEALQARLDYQVEQGLITQEQADEFAEWHQSRPEGVSPRGGFGGGDRGFHRGGRFGGHGPCGAIPGELAPEGSPTAAVW
jgi:hypothetical protein